MSIVPKSVFSFLKTLKKNNNREWFELNKKDFKAIENDVKTFGNDIKNTLELTENVDKVKLFRIYRDVRFSKDKTPYKTHFGISFHREKPQYRGGYYIHLEPDNNFLAIGFWSPEKKDLFRIRKEFEIDATEFKEITQKSKFKKTWGNLEGDALKTAPKGFSKEDPNIDLIRQKMIVFTKKYKDEEVLHSDFKKQVVLDFKNARPFLDYMSSVLTTDLNGVSII